LALGQAFWRAAVEVFVYRGLPGIPLTGKMLEKKNRHQIGAPLAGRALSRGS
jgi:hypothetical protein